ncbi:antibiotic biosynthesis monooxygenase family protein [Trinickia dinghuensis]|uniref:Antibiotic biosynthesis monooxygenase n=1 Tax=Trinickia dinghuensis TaxID=2291023 RepID=A0A3D8JYC4_9BURK|nr:antibiotic biosynthesis monooxygenase [Trinickia dinghuensis]RDU97361.1 antibiotic biosynthesis monooxygenase [Trinickia dinghuensis]
MSIAETGATPYYAVIFTSTRTEGDNGYGEMSELMEAAARKQPGFLGVESAREEIGITVSYWRDLESIAAWKADATHMIAQKTGREKWYEQYVTRVCKVERDYTFKRD